MLHRILIYGLILLSLFLAIQWGILYVQGEARSFSSLYRSNPVPIELKPQKLHKGEVVQTLDCVPIQAIVGKDQRAALPKSDPQFLTASSQSQRSTQTPSQTSEWSGPLLLPQIPDKTKRYPYLLNRFSLKAPILENQSLEFYLQEDGSTSLWSHSDPSLFQLGRLREFGLWVGYEYAILPDATLVQGNSLGLALDLSYQQDLFKLGPVWTRGRIEAGWSKSLGINTKAQIGIPVIRF